MRKVRLTMYGIPFGQVMFEDYAKKIVESSQHSVFGIGLMRVIE